MNYNPQVVPDLALTPIIGMKQIKVWIKAHGDVTLLCCTFEQELRLITIIYVFLENLKLRREYVDPDFYSNIWME